MSETNRPEDPVTRFSTEVKKVGGHFASVPDLAGVTEYIAKVAVAARAKQIVVGGAELSSHLIASQTQLPCQVVSRANVTREDFFEALKSSEIGVSPADLGVAETGTLFILTRHESDRLVTALPAIHIAVLPSSKLVFSLEETEQYVSQFLVKSHEAVCVSLISASSRTSDVGGMTILGAHGPKELHVLLFEDLQGGRRP